jgi:hypothetical protein
MKRKQSTKPRLEALDVPDELCLLSMKMKAIGKLFQYRGELELDEDEANGIGMMLMDFVKEAKRIEDVISDHG